MAPGEPPRKPWGAPASYGRGAKKPPAVGARARRSSAPVYNPPVPRAARGDDDEGDSAPSRAGTVDDANFRAWQRVASNAKASSRPEKDPTPPSPFGSDIDALAAPDGSYVPLGEHTHASFHDLGPEEKRKVAKLIRQVVELSEARSKLEKELDELRARCVTEEGARKDAQAAEANGRAEIETLRGKLARALATINALARGDARASLAMGQASGELTITPLPDTPAKAAASNVAANGVVSEPTDDASIDSCAHRSTVGSPPETIVVRTSGVAREEATPTPSTPPAVVIAAAAAAAAAAENAAAPANAKAATAAKPPPPASPFIPGLSPGSARDLRWLSAVQSGTSRAPAWAKASMLAAAARNAAALKTAPGSDSSSSPGPATPVSATRSARSGATMNLTLSPDSSVSVAAPSPPNVNDAGRRPEDTHESSRSVKDGEGRARRERTPSVSAPELPPEVLDAAKRAAAADPDDPLVAALAAAAAAQAGIHWEPFGMNSPAGVGSPRAAAAAAEQGGGAERPKVLRFDPEMGPSGAFYFADASVDTTSASSMAAGSPVGDPCGGDSFDSSFAVERVHAHTSAAETNEGTESGEESAAPKKKGGGGGDVVADVAEKVTGRTVAAVLGVDEDGRRVSAEEAARFMLRVDREMTSYAAAAAAPQSAPVTHPSPLGFMAPPTATRRHQDLDHDATFAFSDASFSAVVHPPDMSPPSRIIEEFLVLKGTTPAPAACDGDKVFKKQQSTGAPSPETAAALEACLGVTEPRADPVGDHVSSAPVTPVRAFDEFVKRRHGDGRASSIVQIAAEQVRLGAANNTSGARGARAGATSASSPAPPPSSLGGFDGASGKKPAFVLTPNSLATRREKAAAVAERLLALERTEAAAGEVVAAERVEVPSPSPERPPAEAAAARTPAPVAWEIPSPEPPPAEAGSKPAKSKPVESTRRRRAVAGADGTPPREKDTPARLLDDARAFAFDVSLVDLVDEAEAMLREEEDEDEEEDTRTRGGATNHKPPSPRTGDTKRRASGGAGGRVTPAAGRKNPQGSSKGSRAPLGPMRQRDYNKFGGVRTPPSGGERKKPGWFTSYRSFSVGRAGEPGL